MEDTRSSELGLFDQRFVVLNRQHAYWFDSFT